MYMYTAKFSQFAYFSGLNMLLVRNVKLKALNPLKIPSDFFFSSGEAKGLSFLSFLCVLLSHLLKGENFPFLTHSKEGNFLSSLLSLNGHPRKDAWEKEEKEEKRLRPL